MVEPLSPEEIADLRKAHASCRATDDVTLIDRAIHTMFALAAARETPADLAYLNLVADWAALMDHLGLPGDSTAPDVIAAGVRAAPPSEDAARLREAITEAIDYLSSGSGVIGVIAHLRRAVATPAAPTEPTPEFDPGKRSYCMHGVSETQECDDCGGFGWEPAR